MTAHFSGLVKALNLKVAGLSLFYEPKMTKYQYRYCRQRVFSIVPLSWMFLLSLDLFCQCYYFFSFYFNIFCQLYHDFKLYWGGNHGHIKRNYWINPRP
jgi:hypothetical protein